MQNAQRASASNSFQFYSVRPALHCNPISAMRLKEHSPSTRTMSTALVVLRLPDKLQWLRLAWQACDGQCGGLLDTYRPESLTAAWDG